MKRATLAVAACLFALGCARTEPAPAAPRIVRLAAIRSSILSQQIARVVNETTRGVRVEIVEIAEFDAASILESISEGRADVAVVATDAVYLKYVESLAQSQPGPPPLRAIGALDVLHLYLLAAATSGIRTMSDLPGHAVAVSVYSIQPLVLEMLGVRAGAIKTFASAQEAAEAVFRREVDAAIVAAFLPSDVIRTAIAKGSRLVPLSGELVNRVRRRYRFARGFSIPAGTYPHQAESLSTLGVGVLIVCREDLDESLAYAFTKELMEALPSLSQTFNSLKVMDIRQVSVTPIPLHVAASRYYREAELLH